jgi:hypothetical protein
MMRVAMALCVVCVCVCVLQRSARDVQSQLAMVYSLSLAPHKLMQAFVLPRDLLRKSNAHVFVYNFYWRSLIYC